MITVTGLTKRYDDFTALDTMNMHVESGSIYGLIGPNGSGKTTLIRTLMGVLKAEGGEILYDGEPVYENPDVKRRIGYVPDDFFTANNDSLNSAAKFYRGMYPSWNQGRFEEMCKAFKLNPKQKIRRFSKGMKKQAKFILVMSQMPDYLLLDEPIDGLDPLMRKRVWKYIIEDVADRNISVLVSSHNLKELEDIVDHIGILHKGKMMMEADCDDLKGELHRLQVAFKDKTAMPEDLNVLYEETHGSVTRMIVRGNLDEIEEKFRALDPILFDVLPVSLEEVFIYELGSEEEELRDLIF